MTSAQPIRQLVLLHGTSIRPPRWRGVKAQSAGADEVAMGPEEYEHHVADVHRENGWTATVTPMGGYWGLDVVAERQGRRLGVQVKKYGGSTRKVNREQVMCLRGPADYQNCHQSDIGSRRGPFR